MAISIPINFIKFRKYLYRFTTSKANGVKVISKIQKCLQLVETTLPVTGGKKVENIVQNPFGTAQKSCTWLTWPQHHDSPGLDIPENIAMFKMDTPDHITM